MSQGRGGKHSRHCWPRLLARNQLRPLDEGNDPKNLGHDELTRSRTASSTAGGINRRKEATSAPSLKEKEGVDEQMLPAPPRTRLDRGIPGQGTQDPAKCVLTRVHLPAKCEAWSPQINTLWRDVRKACGWKHCEPPQSERSSKKSLARSTGSAGGALLPTGKPR